MSDKIKMRRGELPDLPDLDAGEFGLATDVNSVYIGNPDGNGNILVNPVKEYMDGYSIDGYLVPAVDNSHGLGSPSLRWNNIVVGPDSIHIRSLPGEISAGERNWNIGIDDAGRLSFNSDGYVAYSIAPTGTEAVLGTVFSAADGSASSPSYSFTSGGTAGLYQSGTNEISISTSALQRLVIDSSGNLALGSSSPSYFLDVSGNDADWIARFFNDGNDVNRRGVKIQCGADDMSSGVNYFMGFYDGDGGIEGYIYCLNGIVQLVQFSDQNIKTDIADTEVDALDIVNNLEVKEFRFKKDEYAEVLHPAGFIAQNVQKYIPEAVGGEDGTLMLSQTALIPYLTKAIQQLDEKVDLLTEEVNLLKTQVNK